MTKTITLRTINLEAASVDIGDAGMPGSGATQTTCRIIAWPNGQWTAEGAHSRGCNQGYYQENYGYGPWIGKGASPSAAVAAMVRRTDDEYQSLMRRAGHDALLEVPDTTTYAALAAREIDRIESVIRDTTTATKNVRIAGDTYLWGADMDPQQALRRRAVTRLRRLAKIDPPSAVTLSDDELLSEMARRGMRD